MKYVRYFAHRPLKYGLFAGIIAVIGLLSIVACKPDPHPIPPAPNQAEIDAFFASQVPPALDAYHVRNKMAVERAVNRISRGVEEYRNGIEPLVEDITSWGTRFGIIRHTGSDLREKWWGDPANATAVHCYVSKKFETNLFSEAKLNALLTDSLNQFRDDLIASQNILHADVKTSWTKSGHAEHELDIKQIFQEANASFQTISSDIATDSFTDGMVNLLYECAIDGGTAILVKFIIARVATHISTSAAMTTVVSGGATTTTTAAGGSGGTILGGPLGSAIGVAAGLLVGIIADWWMTNKLEKKLTAECNQMIDSIKGLILVGTSETPGVKSAFMEFINLLRIAEEDEIRNAIQGIAQ